MRVSHASNKLDLRAWGRSATVGLGAHDNGEVMAGVAAPAKLATTILEAVSRIMWNVKANLMSDIVERHGGRESLKWFASNMPTYEKILKSWGPLRTHILAVAISATNGCRYCTYGHAYAYQLHWFEQFDEPFPIDEHAMTGLSERDQDGVVAALDEALAEAGGRKADEDRYWLARLVSILDDPDLATTEQGDRWLSHLIEMFGFLNRCGIDADTALDEAHDPINKDEDLRARYAARRLG